MYPYDDERGEDRVGDGRGPGDEIIDEIVRVRRTGKRNDTKGEEL